jgi:hypothetical protein
MYEVNICSPIYDVTQDGSINLRATRILFGVDLLLLCLIYNLTSFFLKRTINDLKLEDKQSNDSRIEQLQYDYKVPFPNLEVGAGASPEYGRPHCRSRIRHLLLPLPV